MHVKVCASFIFFWQKCAQRGARKMLNQEIHTRNVTEIMIIIQDCTSKRIPEDDVDVQRARAKVAMLGIGKKKTL
jgi:hypothetical protein